MNAVYYFYVFWKGMVGTAACGLLWLNYDDHLEKNVLKFNKFILQNTVFFLETALQKERLSLSVMFFLSLALSGPQLGKKKWCNSWSE